MSEIFSINPPDPVGEARSVARFAEARRILAKISSDIQSNGSGTVSRLRVFTNVRLVEITPETGAEEQDQPALFDQDLA